MAQLKTQDNQGLTMYQSTPALASAVGGLLGLVKAGAEGIQPTGLLARAAPAAIGSGIAALAAGASEGEAMRMAEMFGVQPAMNSMPQRVTLPQTMVQRPMFNAPVRMARDGGYISGPGTGRSDSIPAKIYQDGQPVQEARLSDGEFVMTERAVRGAGNGDRAAGAARMYRLMREFENGGRV